MDRIAGASATQRSFTPRYVVELTATGAVYAPDTSRSSAPSLARPRRAPVRRSGSPFGQLKHVFQCTYCGKRFQRGSYDSTLNPHKTKSGYPCPGRVGAYIGRK